jgi:molybdate transport system substrate-binding protein
VELNFAGSQALRTQIEQGAPVDVFASADPVHADALRAARLLGPTRTFARNRLVVAVPASGARVARLHDLVRTGTRIVVAAPTVPAGRYTAQVLGRLAAAGLYGDDFQARVQANVASLESNVRTTLAKVALGEADAAFVYATDAAAFAGKVRAIDIPDRYNVVAEYPIGVVTGTPRAAKAQAFVDLVLAREGQAILRRRGFGR